MANLNLKSVYKVYPNGTKAVNDFSMDIEDKEFIVFVGPSGCGKSTVLRMIAGLEEISAGELKIDDKVVNDVDCKNRDTAMVFQNYALYPHMTVADNMAFPLKMSKLTKEQKKELSVRVDEKYPRLTKAARGSDKYINRAQIKKEYKAGKKVVLGDEDKREISRRVKEEYTRGLKNFCLKPVHYALVKRDYKANIRDGRDLVRPVSLLNNLLKPFHTAFVRREETYAQVIKIAEILGLEEYLGKRPGAMSGGQRQRVALGRAMVRNPKVFLLDEPLSNLDAKLRNQMRSEITKLHNRLQTTFVYVTHDQVEAMTMGDRIVVMKSGRIQQTDTPINLYSYPENAFVAGFIGTPSMNFFDAVVEVAGDKASVAFANGKKMEFSSECVKKLERKYLGKAVKMGVRPEDFILDDGGVECAVLNKEMLGSETLLYCDFDTDGATNYESGKFPFVIKVEGIYRKESGDTVRVGVNFAKVHFFDKDTEESVNKRFVSYNDVSVKAVNGKLYIGGKAVALPPALAHLDGEYNAIFPTSAFTEGGLEAEVLECEQLKQGWLARLAIGGEKLYGLFDCEVGGKISVGLAWHSVAFSHGDKQIPALDTENRIGVRLRKRKLDGAANKREKRSFDVDVICCGTPLVCPLTVLKRLLGASDRKLFGTDLQLIFSTDAVTSENTFSAKILKVLDYGVGKYAVCSFAGNEIVLPYNGESGSVNFGIDLLKSSVYDHVSAIKIT